mmetsp:Transcript_39453/g.97814  ORF Transcript_39453/g.97814 Transcript_39453/m.97814 type:complete len:84 (+) Transcript_39453:500-751(+)
MSDRAQHGRLDRWYLMSVDEPPPSPQGWQKFPIRKDKKNQHDAHRAMFSIHAMQSESWTVAIVMIRLVQRMFLFAHSSLFARE